MTEKEYFPCDTGLSTDLYQLTMAAGYWAAGRGERAVFELFARRLPPGRSWLVAAGLETALDYLTNLRLSDDGIGHLRGLPAFATVGDGFFEFLRTLRFTGDVWAIPEGTPVFAGEPLLRVSAPLVEAQLAETFLLSTVNFQTLIATKASRVVRAARGRGVVEFGARRAHTMGAAFYGARAAFIGGCIGTSNVEAGRAFDIPVFGTSAHSFIMSFPSERESFDAYFRLFPESTTLLLDTYDTIAAAHLATAYGPRLRGVRLDSGDMGALSREVRAILDTAGMYETKVMASGDLDEAKISDLVSSGAPIDLFGVGTEIATSYDAPALGGVYKLVEIASDGFREGKMKLSPDKSTYPHPKQVWRSFADDDSMLGDLIAHEEEDYGAEGREPLLRQVVRGGALIEPLPDLRAVQSRARRELDRLPEIHRRLRNAAPYPVRYSERLETARLQLSGRLSAGSERR
jgi:nicotinate phosphoribosyltransferase